MKKVYYVTDPHSSPLPIKIVLKHFALASNIIHILTDCKKGAKKEVKHLLLVL